MVGKRKASRLSPVEVKMYDEYVEKYDFMKKSGVVQRSFDDLATAINVECHDGNEVMTAKKLFRRFLYMKARQVHPAVKSLEGVYNGGTESVCNKFREIKRRSVRYPGLVQILDGLVDAMYDLVIENEFLRRDLRELKSVQSAVENYQKRSELRGKE